MSAETGLPGQDGRLSGEGAGRGHGRSDPAQLLFAREWGRDFFHVSPFLCAVCRGGRIVLLNPAGSALLHLDSPAQGIGQPFTHFLHPEYRLGPGDDVLAVLAEEAAPVPLKLLRRDGSSVDVTIHCFRGGQDAGPGGADAAGDAGGATSDTVLVLARDVTEHLRSAHAILQSETRYRELVNHAFGAIIVCDGETVTFANAAAAELFGASGVGGTLVGRSFWSLMHGDYRDALREDIDNLVSTAARVPVKVVIHGGVLRDVKVVFIPMGRGGSGHFMVEAWDITDENRAVAALRAVNENLERLVDDRTRALRAEVAERRRAEEAVRHQALHDTLTGLPNRVQFFQRLRQEVDEARATRHGVGLFFIDLDGFKAVNDTLGHDAGDLLLKAASARMRDCIRPMDVVCRLAGDEFTVIVPRVEDKAAVASVADRILKVLDRPFDLSGRTANISGSIGISRYPGDGDTIENLLQYADEAMYRSKRRGKGVHTFHDDAPSAVEMDHIAIRECLHFALERNELALWYLPKVDLSLRVVTGFEALLRWRSPELGLVMPGRLFAVVDEAEDYSDRIADWVTREACRQAALWSREGYPDLTVAINLSTRQLRSKGFVDMLERCLNEYTLLPARLEVEVTEASILADVDKAMPVLSRLNDLGVPVIIDDFGTGYSSLRFLQRMPIRAVKIDRAIVANMEPGSDDEAIVRSIITTAHTFGRRVVAEGVETMERLNRLAELGCDAVQGYILSPPMAADETRAFLQHPLPLIPMAPPAAPPPSSFAPMGVMAVRAGR